MKLFLILILCASASGHFVLLPNVSQGMETEINWSSISCDIPLPSVNVYQYQQFSYLAFVPVKEPQISEGYLCSKEIWRSICEEGFFGQTTKKFSIIRSPITETECIQSITKFEEGVYDIPFKPEYTCSWLMENSNDRTFILIKKHDMAFDHYDLSYKDGIFLTASCHKAVCETRYDSLLWLAKSHGMPRCPGKLLSTTTIYYNNNTQIYGDFIVSNDYIPYERLHGSCKGLHYCGIEYILTPFGQGFSIPRDISIFPLESYIKKLPTCAAGKMVSIAQSTNVGSIRISIEEEFRVDRCLDAIEKLKSGQSLSRRYLYRLGPVLPGFGVGFIIRNKTVRSIPVSYTIAKIIKVDCSLPDGRCTVQFKGYNNDTQTISFDCVNKETAKFDQYFDWVNGMLIKGNRIIVPDSGIRGRELMDIITEEHEVFFDPHVMLNETHKGQLSGVIESPHFRNGNFWEYVTTNIEQWILNIVYWSLGILVVILMICFCPFQKIFQ